MGCGCIWSFAPQFFDSVTSEASLSCIFSNIVIESCTHLFSELVSSWLFDACTLLFHLIDYKPL